MAGKVITGISMAEKVVFFVNYVVEEKTKDKIKG